MHSRLTIPTGTLAIFDPAMKSMENIPFVTCSHNKSDEFWLYETIDMDTFPSWSDFKGYSISLKRGDRCLVLRNLGMPLGIAHFSLSKPGLDLNVYSVLAGGRTVEVFGCDLVCDLW